MAIKGLSKLVVGKYTYSGSGNNPTYSDNETVAKMIEYSLSVNQSDDNTLYADNMELLSPKPVRNVSQVMDGQEGADSSSTDKAPF